MATAEWTPLLTSGTEAKSDDSVSVTILSTTVIACTNKQGVSGTASGTVTNDARCHNDTVTNNTQDSSNDPPNRNVTRSNMGDLKAVVTVIKSNIGPGILAAPYAMYCSGLLVGPVCMFLMGVIVLCCSHFLIQASRIQQKRAEEEGKDVDMSYANLMAWSLRTAYPSLREWPAVWGSRFVSALLVITQLGFCSVYIVFVAANVSQAVYAWTSWDMAIWKYQLAVACPLLPYSQLRGINKMAPCSFLANCLMMLGLIIIFANFWGSPLPEVTTRPAFAGWTLMPAYFGMVVFSLEGTGLVLPVEMQVKNKETFSAPCGVLTVSLMVVIVLFTAMGFFGYLVYGDHTQASITLNLPTTPWYYFAAKPVFAVAVFLSYNLQLFVPVSMVKNWLVARYGWNGAEFKNKRHLAEAGVRLSFFLITLVMAMVVPDLDLLISFVGAVASSILALILLAFIYLLTVMTQPQRPRVATVIFTVFTIILGLFGFVISTYTSIISIVLHNF